MTQIGEAVKPGMIAGNDNDCPFNHDIVKPPVVQNEFKGDAPSLEQNMAAAVSSHTNSRPPSWKPDKPPPRVLCPNYDKNHPFYDGLGEKNWPVVIEGYRYPVTCAPHHLIPAQESLKRSRLTKYMIWQGQTEPVTNGKPLTGVCFSDVGYNVNGAQNGVFLPGSYGVTLVGTGDWTATASAIPGESWADEADADNERGAARAKLRKTVTQALTGLRHEVHPDNRKWNYVKQAVKKAPGQFHDRHPDYSKEVIKALDAIAQEYDQKKQRIEQKLACKRCQKRFDEFKDQGLPTPFKLVDRLNSVSARYRGLLQGQRWVKNIYTSKWGLAYMRAVKERAKGV